jgi:hypothetical protein
MIVVVYWMKGKPKDSERFDTLAEARAFMKALAICDSCEGYGIDREVSNHETADR